MLRTPRYRQQRNICWEDCFQISPSQTASKG